MFFDIGWSEFMVIGVVALVVIGPKDLPAALRVAGYWVRKARTLSREFHSSVEQMMREVELHEVQNELRKATEIDLDREFNKIMDPVNDPAAVAPKPVQRCRRRWRQLLLNQRTPRRHRSRNGVRWRKSTMRTCGRPSSKPAG